MNNITSFPTLMNSLATIILQLPATAFEYTIEITIVQDISGYLVAKYQSRAI